MIKSGDIVDFRVDESYHGSCLMVVAIDPNSDSVALAPMNDAGDGYDMDDLTHVDRQHITRVHSDLIPAFIK